MISYNGNRIAIDTKIVKDFVLKLFDFSIKNFINSTEEDYFSYGDIQIKYLKNGGVLLMQDKDFIVLELIEVMRLYNITYGKGKKKG